MAAMKRERQFDMFDVATGVCELDNYLTQRYSENDLSSKFWIEPADQVDELRPPKDGVPVVIPIQGPSVTPPTPPSTASEPLPSRPPWEQAPTPDSAMPARPAWEASSPSAAPSAPAVSSPTAAPATRPIQPSAGPASVVGPAVPPAAATPAIAAPSPPEPTEAVPQAPLPPSMAELLAQFHQAAKAYEERAKDEPTSEV